MKNKKPCLTGIFILIIFFAFSCFYNTVNAQTIKIGTQNWCIKNLDVSTYRNGDTIPEVQDAAEWDKLKTGAWCYYENNNETGATYGKLYNWYAVTDPRGLAPEGFHIPGDQEWKILIDFLGGEDNAGTKMKSKSGWYGTGNATNSSGFAALPGGYRAFAGAFGTNGRNGYWWSSTEDDITNGWYRFLNSHDGHVYRNSDYKFSGFSVRCLGD